MPYYNQKGSRFKSVDGRIYKSEIKEKDAYVITVKQEDSIYQKTKMSAQQVFDVECYLSSGRRPGLISIKDKERIIQEYSLEKNNGKGAYIGDPQNIYKILKEKYPESVSRFHNNDGKGYKRIVYAVYYGEAPCIIIKPTD